MPIATMTSKGQVTIPREVRADLDLSIGDRLDFVRLEDGNYAIVPASGSIMSLHGVLPPRDTPVSLQEMEEAIAAGAEGAVTGLDTNVLVRFLAKDDPIQAALAREFIRSFSARAPGFVSTVTLVETTWVLAKAYRLSRAEVARIVERLLRAREIVIEDASLHYRALRGYRAGSADYADVVIAETSRRAGCREVVTFDRRAAGSAGMRLLA